MNLTAFLEAENSVFGLDRPAIVFRGASWTYADLFAEARTAAGALAALGLGTGDRVLALMGNRPECFSVYLGCASLGAVYAPMNLSVSAVEAGAIAAHLEPCAVVVDDAGARHLHASGYANTAPAVAVEDVDGPLATAHMRELATRSAGEASCDVLPEDPVLITYSSGSTARPKPIVSSHGAEIWAARAHRSIWRLNVNDVVYDALPLAWVYGLATSGTSALAAGAAVVLAPRFHPAEACEDASRHGPTVLIGVTTMFRMLADYMDEHPADAAAWRHLRLAVSGGERRDEPALERFSRLTGTPVHDAYASAEARPIATYDPLRDPHPRPGSCGRLVPGVEAELRDRDGRPTSGSGELWVRSPGVFSGYFKDPEGTTACIDDAGWVRVGDVLRFDDDAYCHVQQRTSDVIYRGGAAVAPAQVEDVLRACPQIRAAAVVGRPHPRYGEEVVAFVVIEDPAAGSLLRLVRQACEGAVAEFKVPTAVYAVDRLPVGSTGKTDRRELIRRAAALQAEPDASNE